MIWTAVQRQAKIIVQRGAHRVFGSLLGLVFLFSLAGCGGETIDTSQIKQHWSSQSSEHFVLYFPPDSPRLSRMDNFAKECEELYAHVLRVLQVTPDEPVELFLFTTDNQSDSLIGRPAGFFDNGRIFMKIGQHPGGYIALAGCRFIDKQAQSFDVLKSGMYQLYAQPSVNVHVETFGFERSNRLIPLAELDDPTVEKDPAVYQTEAASLCAFLLARFGPERFKMLWRSVLNFPDSLEKIYRLQLGRFETQWRNYYHREARRT
jgi:hypothetical protein